MGIRNGAPNILKCIKRGLYHRSAKNYTIYVDGEFMRYKGMIDNNMAKADAEAAIAQTSFEYLRRIVNDIEELLGKRAKLIKVFMDGERVSNKTTKRSEFYFDSGLIRVMFKRLCACQQNFAVKELKYGESELQMYLTRDQSNDLNVFLTNDSDMISICYGHTPKVSENYDRRQHTQHQVKLLEKSIADDNNEYVKDFDVLDSCVWINCGREVRAIGFDFITERVIYTPRIFRTFVAFCQTDFTENLFPESMINGILHASDEDKQFINGLTDINAIAAALQVLGIRGGGSIKRDRKLAFTKFDPTAIELAVLMYIQYISTGSMPNCNIPSNDMSYACRQYLYAMRRQDTCFTLKALREWAKSISLSEAIDNLNTFIDDPMTDVIAAKKRKIQQLE